MKMALHDKFSAVVVLRAENPQWIIRLLETEMHDMSSSRFVCHQTILGLSHYDIIGLAQDCSNSTAKVLDLRQICTEPSICLDGSNYE